MSDNIAFGKPDEQWSDYGIIQRPILYGQGAFPQELEASKYKAIIRHGELVAIMTHYYELLPNEKVAELADVAAKMVGLKPFNDFHSFGMHQVGNALYNNKETVMHAMYNTGEDTATKNVAVGDIVNVGVDVHNSIDGTTGFGIGIFSYRLACKNGAIMRGEMIGGISQMHSQGLVPIVKQMKTLMVSIMDRGKMVIEGYKKLATEQVTDELIAKLKKSRIPKSVMPEFMQTEKDEKPVIPSGLTQWHLYNKLTENIWHNEKSGLRTREAQFNALHAVIPVIRSR